MPFPSASGSDRAPLVQMGHGGGTHKKAPAMVGRAHRLVTGCGFHVATIDAPGHGGRPRTATDEREIAALRQAGAAGEPEGPIVVRYNGHLAELAVPEWRATLDALPDLPEIGTEEPVGYYGLNMGTAIGCRWPRSNPGSQPRGCEPTRVVRYVMTEGSPMTDESPWEIERLDLNGYLVRLPPGDVAGGPPSRAALDALHEAHVRTFTFDNIDVLLDQHPGVDLAAVQAKFVGRGRGGYCFEHGTLFAAALERLGYQVERRLGRVGDPATSARTHCVVVVTVNGQRLLADPGFGISLLRPIPLADGATDDHGGWTYQVRQVPEGPGFGWALYRLRGGRWDLMHTHDELPVRPADIRSGHHFTSTYPSSHFRRTLIVAGHLPDRHVTVTHESVTVRRPGAPTEHRPLRDGELPELLDLLGVPITDAELVALLRRVRDLPGS
ncbi:MAG TPA: arylamine N-acetyltransferase [Nakamurella sp.]